MKKLIALAATTVVLAGVFAPSASAQESKPLGLSVRGGIFWPSMDRARKAGKSWIGFGVEYKLGDVKYAAADSKMSASYSLSADFYQKSDFRHVPVLINAVGRSQEVYYFAGAGVGFTREKDNNNVKKNHTGFAYQIGIGYEFAKSQTPVFIEAKYVGNSRNAVNGFGAFVGVRF